ncbi:MAG: ABC transporter permease [Desulfuromonadales bacterium]|nr:ABC transporter permease [Desulfuromonadales bacterium]
MWRRIIALMQKEFLALFKDKRSRFIIIIPPLVQLLVFSYAATYDLNQIPFAVFNEDPGLASRQMLARFTGSPSFQLVGELDHEGQIAPLVDAKQVLMVLHFEPHFSRDLQPGRATELQLIVDGRNSNTASILVGYVRNIVIAFNDDWAEAHGRLDSPARLNVRAWFNANFESRWFIVPGIVGLLTLVVSVLVTALSVAREREAGTFDQLLITPLRPLEILIGKVLPGFIIGAVEATFIIIVAVTWFHIPLRGSLPALYVGLFLFLLSAIGVGLMISSIAVTQQQGLLGAFLFLVPAVILSGFATPIANMPELVQQLTLLNPLRYFLLILRGVFLEGDSLTLLWPQYWPMAIIGLVTLVSAGWFFRHRLN